MTDETTMEQGVHSTEDGDFPIPEDAEFQDQLIHAFFEEICGVSPKCRALVGLIEQRMQEGSSVAPEIEIEPKIESDGTSVDIDGHKYECPKKPEGADVFVPVPERFIPEFWTSRRSYGAIQMQHGFHDFAKLLAADCRCLLTGPPGVGKTAAAHWFAAMTGWPFIRFNGHRDATIDDFVGYTVATGGETKFQDGPLPTAMKMGAILLIDEADHMPAECSSVLHAVMEPGGLLLNTRNGGEVVVPHKNFRVVMTANTAGYGDEGGTHANAKVQDAALLSRIGFVFRVTWLKPEHEQKILQRHLSAHEAKLVVKAANATRNDASIQYPITLRQTMDIAVARAKHGFELEDAFALCVLNKSSDMEAAPVLELIQRATGLFSGK